MFPKAKHVYVKKNILVEFNICTFQKYTTRIELKVKRLSKQKTQSKLISYIDDLK